MVVTVVKEYTVWASIEVFDDESDAEPFDLTDAGCVETAIIGKFSSLKEADSFLNLLDSKRKQIGEPMEFAEVFGMMLADMDVATGDFPDTNLKVVGDRVDTAAMTYGGNDFWFAINGTKAVLAYRSRVEAKLQELRNQLGDWDMANLVAEAIPSADTFKVRDVLLYHRDVAQKLFDAMDIPVSKIQARVGNLPELR